jgi:hypothetical protein
MSDFAGSLALAVGLRWIKPLGKRIRTSILAETVEHLCDQGLHEEALSLARRIPKRKNRPEVLAVVARSSGRPDLTVEALESLLTVPVNRWTATLAQLVSNFAELPQARLTLAIHPGC